MDKIKYDMITEDYVSFETAKLLKEKGFDEKGVKVWYDESGEMYYDRREIKYQIKIENHEKLFQCPTLQMAMKWLREVHSIDISIAVRFWNKDKDALVKSWKYTVYRTDEIESFGQSNTYEEACEAAIKYCLKNLIKNEDEEEESGIPVPKTVVEAISTLEKILSDEDREYLLKNGAISMHNSLGRWIRNEWGLWTGSELKNELKKKGFEHPDDMSNYIIEEFIKYWNNKL